MGGGGSLRILRKALWNWAQPNRFIFLTDSGLSAKEETKLHRQCYDYSASVTLRGGRCFWLGARHCGCCWRHMSSATDRLSSTKKSVETPSSTSRRSTAATARPRHVTWSSPRWRHTPPCTWVTHDTCPTVVTRIYLGRHRAPDWYPYTHLMYSRQTRLLWMGWRG